MANVVALKFIAKRGKSDRDLQNLRQEIQVSAVIGAEDCVNSRIQIKHSSVAMPLSRNCVSQFECVKN